MLSIKSFVVILVILSTTLSAQIDLDNFKMNFRNIGPAGMSGRVTAIDVDLSDIDRIFVGTASGGVWLSENGGVNWTPLFDDQPCLSIGSIKINQQNTDEIWVGTGEGNPRNSLNTGCGMYKSNDGGDTWSSVGLEDTKVIHRIIVDTHNPETVYAGCMGSPWGPSDRGLYKTIDGGKHWDRILYVDDKTGVADMVMDPTNHKKLIVAMYEHLRTPWDFTSGGTGSGLYITYDGGEKWKQITSEDGLPKDTLGRIGIAIAPSQPHIVYALVEAKVNGLYKSMDGGKKWELVSDKDIGNRPFYYSELYVDPHNENRIWNLWSYVSKSEDGGKTFENMMDYGNNVHPDHHAMWIHPDDPTYIINGNDGGLNISRDRGENWTFIANLPVGQFYHVNVDTDWPYHVYGGMQDNGSWIGPSMVLKRGGIRNYDFQELYFGDGFDVVPYPPDSRYGWVMSQGGNLAYYDRETGASKYVKPRHPEDKPLRFHWNAPIAQDPFNDCGVYYGSQYLHHTDDCGDSWTILSGDLTTNNPNKQKQDKSGGLTIDATNAENNTTILSIAPSPVDKDVIWVGTDDGRLQLTADGGKSWTDLYRKLKGAPSAAYIPQIVVSSKNAGEAFVVVNDYRQNNYSAYAYHTKNYGKTWTRIADDNQIGGFVVSIVQDPEVPQLLFLGTDVGLYFSRDYGKQWQRFSAEDFPHVQVSDLKIQEREADLVIGTFGRALWILDDISPLRKLAMEGTEVLRDSLVVFDVPVAYQASRRSYDGIRFYAQGEFIGDNKSPSRAAIKVYTTPSEDKDTEKKLRFQVLNEAGDTIRTFHQKVKGGLQVVNWYMQDDGIRPPTTDKSKKDDDAPNGARVLPGKYKVIVTSGTISKTVDIEIKPDPRKDMLTKDKQRIYNVKKDFEKLRSRAAQSMDRLIKARTSIANIKNLLESQPDSTQTVVKDLHKKLNADIDSLELLYKQPSGLKGIQRNPSNVRGKINTARHYIRTMWNPESTNAKHAIEAAEEAVGGLVAAVNEFVVGDWQRYVEVVEMLELNPLKVLEVVEEE